MGHLDNLSTTQCQSRETLIKCFSDDTLTPDIDQVTGEPINKAIYLECFQKLPNYQFRQPVTNNGNAGSLVTAVAYMRYRGVTLLLYQWALFLCDQSIDVLFKITEDRMQEKSYCVKCHDVKHKTIGPNKENSEVCEGKMLRTVSY